MHSDAHILYYRATTSWCEELRKCCGLCLQLPKAQTVAYAIAVLHRQRDVPMDAVRLPGGHCLEYMSLCLLEKFVSVSGTLSCCAGAEV